MRRWKILPFAGALKRRLAGLSALGQGPSLDCTYVGTSIPVPPPREKSTHITLVLLDLLCKAMKSYIRWTRCIGQTRGRAHEHACSIWL